MNGNERRRWYQQQCCALKLELGRAGQEYADLLKRFQDQGVRLQEVIKERDDAKSSAVVVPAGQLLDVQPGPVSVGGASGVGGAGEPDPGEGDPGRAP